MQNPPSVAVLVLTHDGWGLLEWGLPSVLAEAERYPGACEVVVVDNDSRDDSLRLLAQRFPSVRVERSPNRVLASYNDVASRVDADALLLLNNDIQLEPECIARLASALSGDTFAVSGSLHREDGSLQAGKVRGRWIHGLLRYERDLDQQAPGPTSFCPGGACLVDRERFRALGGYDAAFLPGYLEDADLGFRAWARGWRSDYEPTAVMVHKGGATLDRMYPGRARDRIWLRNELILAWKDVPSKRLSLLGWLLVRCCAAPFKQKIGVVLGAIADIWDRRREIGTGPDRRTAASVLRRFRTFG